MELNVMTGGIAKKEKGRDHRRSCKRYKQECDTSGNPWVQRWRIRPVRLLNCMLCRDVYDGTASEQNSGYRNNRRQGQTDVETGHHRTRCAPTHPAPDRLAQSRKNR
jgi:hypothetical protein